MIIVLSVFIAVIANEVLCRPTDLKNRREVDKETPPATASTVLGKANDKYCPKTKNEEDRALKKEQRQDLFEGDVIPSKKLEELIAQENKTADEKLKAATGRDVLTFDSMHWKTKSIPYVFDAGLDDRAKAAALTAFQDFATYTCVRFIPRTTEKDYIRYFKGSGCYSYVGRNGGAQDLSIGDGCAYKGTIIHESMHAMGFFHEQTRLDRDKYVKINWDNILKGMEKNFQKYAVGSADYLGQTYDFNSIMHYPAKAFAKDPTKNTIDKIVSVDAAVKMGQREGMSEIDIKQIRKLFQCDDVTTTPTPTTAAPVTTKASVTTSIPGTTNARATTLAPGTTSKVTAATPTTNGRTTIVPGVTSSGSTTPMLISTANPTSNTPVSVTPTKVPVSVERPTTQTTQPIIINPGLGNGQKILIQIKTGASVGTYPQWPTDFSWNTNGMPQTCNCQTCNCRCVHMNEPSAGAEWKSNYLCYKKRGDVQPAIEWSYNGEIEGKRCTHISDPTFAKYWENNFLCVPKDSPYHFVWSFRGPVRAKDMSCLRMGVPGGPKDWMDNYLCGKSTKTDEEDV